MANSYEIVFILDADLSEEERAESLAKHKAILERYEGVLVEEVLWGRRRLAYTIQDKDYGVYYLWYIQGDGNTITELQKRFGYSEEILRFQTVRIEDIQEELAFFQSLIAEEEPEVAEEAEVTEEKVESKEEKVESKEETESSDSKESSASTEKSDSKE